MILDDTTTMWLWLGFGGMMLGTLALLSFWDKFRDEHKYHVILALMVTSIAAAAYYSMASGQGVMMFGDKTVFFSRYIDWVLTTPLLLLSLIFVAMPDVSDAKHSRQRLGLIGAVIFADIAMIATGAIANYSTKTQDIAVWYIASCLWFLVIIWLLFGQVLQHAKAHGAKTEKTYLTLLYLLSAIWIWYPVLWLLGESGYGIVNMSNETAIYAVLDVTAKAVFGVVTLSMLLRLKPSKAE